MVKEIYRILRNRFIIICVILLILVGAIFMNHKINRSILEIASYSLSMICFVSAVIFSVCIPIVIRLLTFNDVKTNGTIRKKKYLQFKNIVLLSVFIGSVFTLYGYYALIYEGLLTVSLLCTLYGIYSVIPSRKTLEIELIEFNVEDYKNRK